MEATLKIESMYGSKNEEACQKNIWSGFWQKYFLLKYLEKMLHHFSRFLDNTNPIICTISWILYNDHSISNGSIAKMECCTKLLKSFFLTRRKNTRKVENNVKRTFKKLKNLFFLLQRIFSPQYYSFIRYRLGLQSSGLDLHVNEENKSQKNEDAKKKPMKEKDECILDVWLLKPKRNKAIQTQNTVFFSSF